MTSNGIPNVLLHVCCAPCAGSIIAQCINEKFSITLFFYNPNIHPKDEYERRKDQILTYAYKKQLPFIDADYSPDVWYAHVKGLEHEPERGLRCNACFDLRLERTAYEAHKRGFSFFATTNGFGRLKDLQQVNVSGHKAAQKYSGLTFLDKNWRLKNAQAEATRIALEENFFRQSYCGCEYSKNHKKRFLTDK